MALTDVRAVSDLRSLSGVKRTWADVAENVAYDPNRTSAGLKSATWRSADILHV